MTLRPKPRRMTGILALARKELADIGREKTITVALVVQLFIAGFSAFLAVGLTGLYDPSASNARTSADVAYVGPGGFDLVLVGERNLDVEKLGAEAAVEAFQEGRIDAVVQETQEANGTRRISLLVEEGGIPATLLITQMKGLLERYEETLRTERQGRLEQEILKVEPPSRAALPYAFVYATLVPLLLFTPVFLSGAVAGDSVTQEVQTRTLVLLRSAPLGTVRILAGKMLIPLLLAPLQFLLWVGLLALNKLPVQNLAGLLALSLACTLVLSGAGVALGAALGRSNAVQAAYALVAILLGLVSLMLPVSPLNLAARLASGSANPEVWLTVGLLALLGVATTAVGMAWAARRLRADQG
ncbi:MAG: ABC transporter permease [Candidatus Thermoplasmatota archaeon]